MDIANETRISGLKIVWAFSKNAEISHARIYIITIQVAQTDKNFFIVCPQFIK
jgi:hypothetical protein